MGSSIVNLLYPPVCVVCETLLPETQPWPHVCTACQSKLVETAPATCRRCAASVGPYADAVPDCPRCRGRRLRFDKVLRLGVYEQLRREVCLRMKHAVGEALAAAAAELLWQQHAQGLRALDCNLVIPIPLHWRHWWLREHNPAQTVAARLARRLHLPCLPRILKWRRSTQPQQSLPASRRQENVRNAFAVRALMPLDDVRILLVDDILTTGATCSEAAKVLKRAGAAAVHVAVICRADGAL